MKRILQLLILIGFSFSIGYSANDSRRTYPTSYNACNGCNYQTTGAIFYDDGGEDGVISDNYQLTTFNARPGYTLSLYFTRIDIPQGAKINIYRGNSANPQNRIESFTSIKKSANIVAQEFTVEYIPAPNKRTSSGWVAHIDEKQATPNLNKVMSQPESDCPYAIPLCANNTVIALGGLYNDLGNISDDDGSCYGGTGSGGSVWYSFTPQSSGPIDFTIFPSGTTDYDFVLWDITAGCQSGKRNELACNYSLYTGITGLSGTRCSEVVGTSDIDCGTSCSDMSKYADCNRFDNRVNVTVGRQYAICVNFYSGSNDGFTLKFQTEPGSVAITDVIPPVITNAYSSNCVTASTFHVTFSEWIDCSTLNNGDFTLAGHTFSVVTSNCFGNRTNNIDFSVSPALTAGTYTVHTTGIKDLCGNMMNSDYNIVIGTPPTPAITPPVLVCKATIPTGYSFTPASQTLTASGGTNYYWYDGQQGATATFSTTTPKTISVTVTKGGCSGTASVNINIANVSVDLGPDQYYCGTPVTLTATPAGAGNVYQFYRNPTVIPFSNGTLVQSGASNVLSGLAPAGYTTYRVIVTNPNGCKAQDDVAVKTNPGTPQISYPGFNYCLGANPVLWTAVPPGGVFSGQGMSNDTFYPSRAGVGTWTITYTLVTPCGTFTNSKTIKVSAGANPSLGLNSTYCYNDTISHPIPNPKCGTYSGPGITNGTCTAGNYNPNFPNIFNPAAAGVGTFVYSYYNAGCANNQTVTIIGPGTVPAITGAGGPYCTNSPPIVLTGSPAGGTFVGPGMTGSTFNPATAGAGTHTINYFVTKCGVNLDTFVQIQVNSASPSASISYAGPFCSSLATPQSVTRTGTAGGTYSASPAGLTIDPSTGAITPNTSTANTYTVTYTIASAGGCPAFSTNTNVTITSGITPTFAAIGPLCQNSVAPALPANSTNATPISGTWSPATISTTTNGTTTYTFTPNPGQCASTTTLNITITSSITPTFAAIGPLCQNSVAPALPLTSTNAINGTWSPATISTTATGTTTYTFTPNAGQCASTKTLNVTINAQVTPTFAAIGPLCQNSVAPALPLSSTNAINGTWSPATINTTTNGTTTYTFTPTAGQCATTTTLNVTITSLITPTFAAIGPLCQNSVAPALPLSSTNAINGTWSPATINTTTNGTTTYTFTPTAGQCASTTTLNITITSLVTPTFAAIGPLCQNSVAPALPLSSTNAINGTWSPASINTAASGTTTYTFTPTAGQCASTTTLNVTITSLTTPTFAAIGPLCQNAVAPALPLSSTNAINGTWSPASINTSASGTTTYTFTPTAGQCAAVTTMDITITPQVTPTFAAIGPLCQNSVAPALPLSSTNAINGTWSPATINTTTNGTTTYTFTPTAGQCATTTTLNITITSLITPTFAAIGPLCQNAVAPILPLSSTNAINGTWSPATINTTASGTTTYTFTPTAGQCATATTMDVTIAPQITPTFAAIGPLCQNSVAPALPLSSTNAINGTWSPATINTSASGTATYTFIPTAGQCATTTTLDVTITPQTIPTFAAIGPLCQNAVAPALPLSSTNAINGTWSPATINTSSSGTTTYTFTPTAGQCAATVTMDVTITPQVTPSFAAIGPLCLNAVAPALPLSSTNAINGTWSPAIINTNASGTTTYTFTPTAGQCATGTTMDVTITPQITPTFAPIGPLCQNAVAPALPLSSTNAINGTWSPAVINTSAIGTITYTFTPAAGQCATSTTLDIVITSQITPTFAAIGPLCQNSVAPTLPISSTNAINGTWSPTTINTSASGTTTYTFTPTAGQCATTTTLDITIDPQITPTFAAIGPLCQNSVAPALPLSSTNAINGTWSPATINTSASGTTTYTFTPSAGQCATTTTMDVTITLQLTPTFAAIGPLCQNSVAPALPLSSTNAINGTWSPATINTSASGTTTYTFTPTAGQCAVATTLDITIDPIVTPSFAAIGPLCQNSVAPALPLSSTNAINGAWNPATINTSSSGTTTYTFTPAAGQCATTTTLDITIDPQIVPTFASIGPLCQNSVAPILPLNSTNAISGTWSPATINTSTNGTTTYTFTPNAGQCATTTTLDIVITSQIIPTFAAIGPLCQNSVAPALPLNSTNAISGTWNPAIINTGSSGTTTYTFTPTVGQCAIATTLDITIDPLITPTFAAIGPLCQNSVAPALPLSSTNAINGTWSPATINTTASGTTTYTFTPTAGQCAIATTLDITVDPQLTPTFASVGPLCQNSVAPALPLSSTNAINGTWSPAIINTSINGTSTYTFTPTAGQCATTTTLDITIDPQITPVFAAIGPLCQNSLAPALPLSSTNAINGTWSPTTINTSASGTTTYTFTPTAGQCATTTTLDITIDPQIIPTFAAIGPLCQNSVAPALPLSSTNAINGTWNPATINTSVSGTTTYTFTPTAGQCATTATLDITIDPQITPTFAAIGPLCQNSVAPALPLSSTNAINGTWSPASINTSASGTTTYTFTPTAGQCATTTTLDITIDPQITPTFAAIGPLCQNSVAPALPLSSTNAINGTWSPPTINTSTNGTTTYTFTPNAGQCAATTTLDIVITSQITPTFAAIGPLCQNSVAPALPLSSTNAINGTWSPATINAGASGTTTYTFTPTAGQCATTTTLDITIDPQITPTFAAIGSLCQNSVAPALPLSSTNAISGTWSPASINSSASGTTTYTFTPTAGQCATVTTLDITIDPQITPTFAAIGPLCQNSVAPALPLSSTNAINGTWSPATINTGASGTTTYTFTPTAGQCATATTMDITITPQVTPTFAAIGPLCQNSVAPALPLSSTNAINGTWSPATINTTSNGTTTYTFTPTAGQCATTATMDVVVTLQITPTFATIGPLCQNSVAPALPLSSTNAINGTWSPASINTGASGTSTYTFTPTAGQCATVATLDITIDPQVIPTFTAIGPLCQNSVAPALPLSSSNAINGTWSPATINTSASGTTTYTFTPTAGQCATTTTLDITIDPQITPTFAAIGPLCQNSVAPALPLSSTNAINGTWSPATINTGASGTSTYTFTPTAGQCSVPTTLDITIDPQIVPTFTPIGSLCQNSVAPSLPLTSTNAINGTWSPAIINTSASGTSTYTFTPAAGQCAAVITVDITIDPQITPAFAAIGPLCQNSAAPALPLSSTNAINGTWNPSIINTSASGTSTYTFTPTAGQCAVSTSISIAVNPVKTTGLNKTICQGNSVTVGSQTFSASGNYTVLLVSSAGCDSTVNLSLTVNPALVPDVTLASNKNNVCPGDPITFTATASNTGVPPTYQWYLNNVAIGSSTPQFISSALNNGDSLMVVITTTATCAAPKTASSNSISAIVNTVSYTKPVVEYCQNTSYTIQDLNIVTSPDPNYLITWTNGTQITTDSTSQYTIDNTTSTVIPFFIRYGNNCKVTDTLSIKVNPIPQIDAVVDLPLVKYHQEVQLDVVTSSVLTYNWVPATAVSNPSIKDPKSTINATTVFTVYAKDNKNCINSDSVIVELIDECQEDYIYIPSAFTPNRDGVNDCFGVMAPPQLSDYKITIFDRWGEKVFEGSNVSDCWDGMFKGKEAISDSYIYVVSFKCYNGTALSKKGTVTLLR